MMKFALPSMPTTPIAAMALATATLAGGCADLAVQGFLSPQGPGCVVGIGTPTSARGTLDVGATTRYETVVRARTSRDATLGITTAEVSFTLTGTADQIDTFGVALNQVVGVTTLACAGGRCETQVPTVVPVVASEAGIVDDERVILAGLDVVPTEVGTSLAATFEHAAELSGVTAFGPLEMQVITVLIGADGARSQPAAFLLDVCDGCLAVDDETCQLRNATVITVSDDVCLPGQDIVSSVCACADGTPADASGCP